MDKTIENKAEVQNKFGNTQFLLNTPTAVLTVISSPLVLTKVFVPDIALAGGVVTITVTIKNTNTLIPATSVIVKDDIAGLGLTFVAGSVKINGVASTANPITGINVGVVAPLAATAVTFDATVN